MAPEPGPGAPVTPSPSQFSKELGQQEVSAQISKAGSRSSQSGSSRDPDLPGPLVPSYRGIEDLLPLVLLPLQEPGSLSVQASNPNVHLSVWRQSLWGLTCPLRHRGGRWVGREPAPLGVNAELETGAP